MLELTSAGYTIAYVSVGMTLLTTVVRSAVLDKEKMKEHKEKLKHHQEQIKEAQKRKDYNAVVAHQQKMMDASMEQMRHGMKPMLFTFIPVILVFGWMNANYNDLGSIYNMTVIDPIPQNLDVVSVYTSPNITYGSAGKELVWRVENVTYSWSWSELGEYSKGFVDVNITAKNPKNYTQTPFKGEYTTLDVEGKRAERTLQDGAVQQLSVKRADLKVGGDTVSYRLEYENNNPFYVATVFGVGLGWIRWYILCGFISSLIFNKLFRIGF